MTTGVIVVIFAFTLVSVSALCWAGHADADIRRRTTTIIEAVVDTQQKWDEKDGYVCSFKVERVPYVFKFIVKSFLPPRVGDVMKIEFIRPKKMDGKPNVLEWQNLTQEIERAKRAETLPPAEVPSQ